MRGNDKIASVGGDVFLSYAEDITAIDPDDYADAISIHEVRNPGDKLSIVVEELEKIGLAMLGVTDEQPDEGEGDEAA